MADARLAIATAPRANSVRWPQSDMTFEGFTDWLDPAHPTKHKENGGVFGGRLRDDTRKRTHVEARSLLGLDADYANTTFKADAMLELDGVSHIGHTTFRHTKESPRYRLWVPLSREVTPEEYTRLCRAVMTTLGPEQFDQSTDQPERFMWKPSARNGTYDHWIADGEPLDVEEWLARPVDIPEPVAEPGRPQASLEGEPTDAEIERAQELLAKRCQEIEDGTVVGRNGEVGGRSNSCITVLPTLYRFVLGGCLDRDTVDEQVFAASMKAEGDPDWSRREYDKTCSKSAWGYAEQEGPDRPDIADPVDDFADVELEPVVTLWSTGREWLLNGILPVASYGILDGPIGSGKSSVVGYVVAELTKKGARIRYCVEDEPIASAQHRLRLLGADMDHVTFDEVPDLATEESIARYARRCAQAGVDLVVLDLPVSANPEYESKTPEKTKRWTGHLIEGFCRKRGIGVLGLHHWNNNSKAGSAAARSAGAGAMMAKSEFWWSVAMSNDKLEQVWSVHARRRVSKAMNFVMRGEQHVIDRVTHPFTDEVVEIDVYTVEFDSDTSRTAHDVARDAEKEFAHGRANSRDLVQPDAVLRFLEDPRKRGDIDEFFYWTTGERWSERTVVARLREIGAVTCTPDGVPNERGRFWVTGNGPGHYP